MSRWLLAFSVVVSPGLLLGCEGEEPRGCASLEGEYVSFSSSDDECDYEGELLLTHRYDRDGDSTKLEEPESQELTCERVDDSCVCSGGEDFGEYEVYLQNGETGDTEYALLSVTSEASPICLDLHVIEPFRILEPDEMKGPGPGNDGITGLGGSGGGGGAGGASGG